MSANQRALQEGALQVTFYGDGEVVNTQGGVRGDDWVVATGFDVAASQVDL